MTEETKQKEKTHPGPSYLETIIIALLITAATISYYDRYMAQKLSVFDLKGHLRSTNAMLLAGEISAEEWQTSLDAVEQLLDNAASNPHHLILMEEVVLRNGQRVTRKE